MKNKKLWTSDIGVDDLNKININTAMEALDIKITEIGADYLTGEMPITNKAVQPYRILHGGISCVLAESLGSIAANLCIDQKSEVAVGQNIQADHIRPVSEGEIITATAKVIHIGRRSHIWHIQIFDKNKKIVCDSKLTMAILPKNRSL